MRSDPPRELTVVLDEYPEHVRPRITEAEAKAVPVLGWNLTCAGCALHGAQWRLFGGPSGRNVPLCAPCNDFALQEQRRHRTAMHRITGSRWP